MYRAMCCWWRRQATGVSHLLFLLEDALSGCLVLGVEGDRLFIALLLEGGMRESSI
jgi:hypothetical protein